MAALSASINADRFLIFNIANTGTAQCIMAQALGNDASSMGTTTIRKILASHNVVEMSASGSHHLIKIS